MCKLFYMCKLLCAIRVLLRFRIALLDISGLVRCKHVLERCPRHLHVHSSCSEQQSQQFYLHQTVHQNSQLVSHLEAAQMVKTRPNIMCTHNAA